MTTNETPPAKKTYTVLADQITLMCQDVEASTPQEAIEIAEQQQECWEPSSDTEYRTVTNRVWDVEADDFIELGTVPEESHEQAA